MKIRRWTSTKISFSVLKNIRGVRKMAVIQLLNYKRSNPAIQLSLVDMLFDTEKRNATYANYDSKYQSTKEEDEIFEEMRACYREED